MTTDGVQLIAAERLRQQEIEGYDLLHDRGHYDDLALAGATYALTSDMRLDGVSGVPVTWPWDKPYWKPTPDDRVRELVKAGALIAAAIDSMIGDGYGTLPSGFEAQPLPWNES
jgi:hypothetical protein